MELRSSSASSRSVKRKCLAGRNRVILLKKNAACSPSLARICLSFFLAFPSVFELRVRGGKSFPRCLFPVAVRSPCTLLVIMRNSLSARLIFPGFRVARVPPTRSSRHPPFEPDSRASTLQSAMLFVFKGENVTSFENSGPGVNRIVVSRGLSRPRKTLFSQTAKAAFLC